MENTQNIKHFQTRAVLRHGARQVLFLEGECPVGDTPMALHARALLESLFSHAEREYFPVAAQELERLAGEGCGYAFSPHRLKFYARACEMRTCVELSLFQQYSVGDAVRFSQNARQRWTRDGRYCVKRK